MVISVGSIDVAPQIEVEMDGLNMEVVSPFKCVIVFFRNNIKPREDVKMKVGNEIKNIWGNEDDIK